MKNKKIIYSLIIAAVIVPATVFAVKFALPGDMESSNEISEYSEVTESSEVSFEISKEISSFDISQTVSEEISEEESVFNEESFAFSVSDEVSEPADTPSLPPEQEVSIPDDTSEEPSNTISVPEINIPTAPDSLWDGSTASAFEKGSGTQNDPFVISTASQLAYFRDSVNAGNDYSGKYICLSQSIKITNINFDSVTENNTVIWEGIGTEDNPFRGTFDGKGHTVFGLYGDGLFGFIEGNVKDVIIADSYVTSDGAVVSTAMKNYDIPEYTPFITGCAVANSKVCGDGGIVGYAGGYLIENCVNASDVEGNGEWTGGIAGRFAMGSMKNCCNAGTVSGGTLCGGVVGNAFNGSFENCYNIGSVNGKSFSGGFAGVNYTSTYVSCGFSDTVSEYAFTEADGTYIKEVKGIYAFTD